MKKIKQIVILITVCLLLICNKANNYGHCIEHVVDHTPSPTTGNPTIYQEYKSNIDKLIRKVKEYRDTLKRAYLSLDANKDDEIIKCYNTYILIIRNNLFQMEDLKFSFNDALSKEDYQKAFNSFTEIATLEEKSQVEYNNAFLNCVNDKTEFAQLEDTSEITPTSLPETPMP